MAKSKSFDESKVTRGPDGRFLAQGGPVELRMVYPDPPSTLPVQRPLGPNRYGGPNYGNYNSSSPAQERLLQINQNGLDMLHQLGEQRQQRRSSKPSRRRGSVA